MKPIERTLFLIAVTLAASLACYTTTAPPLYEPETFPENQPTVDQNITPVIVVSTVAVQSAPAEATLLYISGTTHIESKPQTWPDVDAFLAFLQQVTALGMKWSIGADVGWLEGEPRAAELIQASEALGVQWDIHTHNMNDRAKTAYLIRQYGGHPTSVYSGFLINELEKFLPPDLYLGVSWTPQVLWGAVACPGHRPGCDEQSAGLWSPLSGNDYLTHNPNGNIVHAGGGTHQLDDGRALAQAIANGQYSYPIISFTLMVAPTTLQIVESGDGLPEITAFVSEMKEYSFVRWATIEETAQAWVEAGSVPSRIEMEQKK